MRARGIRAQLAAASGCLLALLLISCGQDVHPLREVEVTGDPAVLKSFQGSWYDYEQVLGVRVRGTSPARLAMRPPPGYRIEKARAEDDEIRLLVAWNGETREIALRRIGDDRLLAGPPSAFCHSCLELERLNVWGLAFYRAGTLAEQTSQETAEAYERSMGWLAGVL